MGHNLLIEDGEASMFSVRHVPWHGLGAVLERPPKTAAEAMQAANLDWEVGLKPVYCMEGGIYHEIADKKAVVRLDKWGTPDCVPFALVGNSYQVLQNREAFAFFDSIIETGNVTFETAGALGNGERVWVLGKVEGDPIHVKGHETEKVEKYLLFSTGHDGRTSVQIRFTPVRVVCQNTLLASLMGEYDLFKVHHTPGMRSLITEAQEAVKQILDEWRELEAIYNRFADRKLENRELGEYLTSVFPYPKRRKNQTDASHEEALKKVRDIRRRAAGLFEQGRGNNTAPAKGTLWAAYNGVVELVDHYWSYPSSWRRLDSIWFGEGRRIKEVAFVEAKKMLAPPSQPGPVVGTVP